MPHPPPSPRLSQRHSSSMENGNGSSSPMKRYSSTGSSSVGSALPPPPVITRNNHHLQQGKQTNYAQNIAKSMTIDEMRHLHQRALKDAEAKQTELRLVLASRYRELVGSSDEVTKMRERAQELHSLVHALPNLMTKLVDVSHGAKPAAATENGVEDKEAKFDPEAQRVMELRRDLAHLPRLIHRALDDDHVHQATAHLLHFFHLVAAETDEYPLANALSPDVVPRSSAGSNDGDGGSQMNSLVKAQMRMLFLHLQILPSKVIRMSKGILDTSASYDVKDPQFGAQRSAAALATLDLLDTTTKHHSQQADKPVRILDMYYESKAKLLQSLLGQLSSASSDASTGQTTNASNAEAILSKIVLILQYDVLMHPYQMFILRKFPTVENDPAAAEAIMKSLPIFLPQMVQAKASSFLAAHLPLIRTKVKTILVEIAGTTAAALGQIRQSLYDKTDGAESMEQLNRNGVCTWEEAVLGMVNVPTVLNATGGSTMMSSASTNGNQDGLSGESGTSSLRKFSLWSVLFSNTFSSLVHSLLTSSFHSVHTKAASTLRQSLANAPPLSASLPHEAYRNTLHIATNLNAALLKVSDDAHELLVHAEERVESENRLRQSLYVQACEIMGRLICELRHMLYQDTSKICADSTTNTSVKELIVGRLCHLLKFRLTTLAKLLDPKVSPAALQGTSGMISLFELESAFDLADDNDDGLITFDEAIEAANSAFSGTNFRGAQMVRETLLLSSNADQETRGIGSAPPSGALPNLSGHMRASGGRDVTLNELVLLSARGLRHDGAGRHSALGTIQDSLDGIITRCFGQWADVALTSSTASLNSNISHFIEVASTTSEDEYKRMYAVSNGSTESGPFVGTASPHVLSFMMDAAFILNRSICPSDSLLPVPSMEYAVSMGIVATGSDRIPTMLDLIRKALLSQSLSSITDSVGNTLDAGISAPSALLQVKNDISFVHACFLETKNLNAGAQQSTGKLSALIEACDVQVASISGPDIESKIEQNRQSTFEACNLFLSPLFGETPSSSQSLGDISGDFGAGSSVGASRHLLHSPLSSTCRFSLLPVQSDRTLADIQLRGKYKEKNNASSRQDTVGSNVVRSGLGFFSSMLKKN